MPEIASRHHLELVNAVVDDALAQAGTGLDGIGTVAVTQGPGLVGALLVGVATAKGLAAARQLPLAPVDHLQGHVAANFLAPDPIEPPFLCLIASGGHTLLAEVGDHRGYTVLGRTLDDAAGEAFDKGARLLGLGYPGGPALSRLALDGDPAAFAFPIAERVAGLDFSFAGLKTALLYTVRDLGEAETRRRAADLAAAYEHAIVEALMLRVERALRGAAGRAARDRRRRGREPAPAAARRGAGRGRQGAAARAVHGQRGDDRLGRALGRSAAVPGLSRPRRLRHPAPPRRRVMPARLLRGRSRVVAARDRRARRRWRRCRGRAPDPGRRRAAARPGRRRAL